MKNKTIPVSEVEDGTVTGVLGGVAVGVAEPSFLNAAITSAAGTKGYQIARWGPGGVNQKEIPGSLARTLTMPADNFILPSDALRIRFFLSNNGTRYYPGYGGDYDLDIIIF